jgi:hypothetical protein
MLCEGEITLTATGNRTTPFPKIDFSTNRRSINTLKRSNKWLLANAITEAEIRIDTYNLIIFKSLKLNNLSTNDIECLNYYLFDPNWILKPNTKS